MGHEPPTLERGTDAGPRRRLTPTMASFRLLVLDFVRSYIEQNHLPPSYGEIGAALDCSRTRVKHAIRSLERDELLFRGDGPRSLTLPTDRQKAIRALKGLGYRIDESARTITEPVTDPPLLPPAALTYPVRETRHESDREQGEHGQGEGTGGEERGKAG